MRNLERAFYYGVGIGVGSSLALPAHLAVGVGLVGGLIGWGIFSLIDWFYSLGADHVR